MPAAVDRSRLHEELGDRAGRPRPRHRASASPASPARSPAAASARSTLLGWSRGGQIGYAYLNGETPAPAGPAPGQGLHPGGHLPEDRRRRTPHRRLRTASRRTEARHRRGQPTARHVGRAVRALGNDAAREPERRRPPSLAGPDQPRRRACSWARPTFQLLGGAEPAPFYHFTGGTFDANGLPVRPPLLEPTGPLRLRGGRLPLPAQPGARGRRRGHLRVRRTCPSTTTSREINVPVLYVGAGGGFGEFGIYTTTLLGSTDVDDPRRPQGARPASGSPTTATPTCSWPSDAQTLVWQPILNWVQAH